jgi:tetratricopeptide (TPR) repeat protein
VRRVILDVSDIVRVFQFFLARLRRCGKIELDTILAKLRGVFLIRPHEPGNPISRRALASLINPPEIFLNRQYTWVLRSIGKSPVNSKSCAIIAPSNGISELNPDSSRHAPASAQLDLFAALAAPLAAIEVPKRPIARANAGNALPALDQLDLFIHTPIDQALSGVRRALLAGDPDNAAQCLAHAQVLNANSARGSEAAPRLCALSDAEICVQLFMRGDFGAHGLADWHWLTMHYDRLARFLGPTSEPIMAQFLGVLAASPALAIFAPAHPNAYAAQIYFDLAEFDLADAILQRDTNARTCPQRLLLWIQVSSARSQLRGDDADLSCLRHWQTLCFDWPEQAEEALGQSARFANAWSDFCDLDGDQAIANFPGFACLNGIIWPAPERQDRRLGAKLIRAVLALNAARDAVPLRLALKALAPAIYQDWLEKRRIKR